jgi:uncharacterized coiled-coil protein SlyX
LKPDETLGRLERLELHLSHVERQSEELNAVVIQQGKEIARLKKVLERLTQSFEADQIERIQSNNPPPPHYGR